METFCKGNKLLQLEKISGGKYLSIKTYLENDPIRADKQCAEYRWPHR